MKAELLDGAPPGTVSVCHPSGWIQSEIFVEWLNHFISTVKPKKKDPVLLLLDGHSTHTKNLPLIEKARDNGIFILSFPPHCTHRLQPLDVSIMGPLSTYYTQEVNMWLRNNPGRVVTQFQLARLFGAAYGKAATTHNAVSGFLKTGIYPTNRHVFDETDFVAAETTDIHALTPSTSTTTVTWEPSTSSTLLANAIPSTASGQIDPVKSSSNASVINLVQSASSTSLIEPTPSTSIAFDQDFEAVSPADVMPIPRVSVSQKRTNNRRGKTAVITSPPYKNELISSQNKIPKLNLDHQKKSKKHTTTNGNDNCLYCLEKYDTTRLNEGWVQCIECKGWAHEGCTGYDSEELDDFMCMGCIAAH